MYGKVTYDNIQDAFLCEFPIKQQDGDYRMCGKWSKDLVRHITRHHRISSREYKKMLGLNLNTPLMSEDTRNKLRKSVLSYGNEKNLKIGSVYRFRPGMVTVQNYKRSEQTRSRLRTLRKKSLKPKKVNDIITGLKGEL